MELEADKVRKKGERAYTTRGRRRRRTHDEYTIEISIECERERTKISFSLFLLRPLPLTWSQARNEARKRVSCEREERGSKIRTKRVSPPPSLFMHARGGEKEE